MAGSNITKQALATALKELMNESSFLKITVSDICDRCGMNRKSFYYHFRDKYDLVNWIFDTEFLELAAKRKYANSWEYFTDLCKYLDENRSFYRRALKITGQNSFSDHFVEVLQPLVEVRLKDIIGTESGRFYIQFFADGMVLAIKRWILEMEDVTYDQFIASLRFIVEQVAKQVYHELQKSE